MAQLEDTKHLIVSDRLFSLISRGTKDAYLTYGNPGIKVYRDGTKDLCDKLDSRTCEQALNRVYETK